jgi:basic membrane lipoprotein Med (substrate-binding protein (PBP1-ABC) superfamily)
MEGTMRYSALVILLVVAAAMTTCRAEDPAVGTFSVQLLSSRAASDRWERAAERGLVRIAAELDADVSQVQVEDPEDARALLDRQRGSGVDIVFGVGAGVQKLLHAEAPAYPKTVFVLLPGDLHADNVGGISFLPEEAGYIAGAVAGAISPNRRVGLLRGEGQPWLNQLEEGFLAGFRSRQPRSTVETAEGREGVASLSEAGVRIALYACDHAESEVLDAAREKGLLLVATDLAQMEAWPETVVAAIDVDVAEAMLRVAREVRDRTFSGRVYAFDLGSGVLDVAVSTAHGTSELAVAQGALDEARSEVTAGLVEFDELGL